MLKDGICDLTGKKENKQTKNMIQSIHGCQGQNDFSLLGVIKSQIQFQSYLPFFPSSVLGDFTFPKIYTFLLGCPFHWHIVACKDSYGPLFLVAVFF